MKRSALTTALIILFYSLAIGQGVEWSYISDTTVSRTNPIVLTPGLTSLIISDDFKAGTEEDTTYNSQTGEFLPLENELYIVRFAFDYDLEENNTYCYFKAFLDVGTGVPPVPIEEFRISDKQGWVSTQETFMFWGGSQIAAEGGEIYFETVTGSAKIAKPNITIGRIRDERETPIVEVSNIETTSDVATTVVAPFTELFQEVTVNTRPEYFTVSLPEARITINKPGIYEVQTGVSFIESTASNTQRDNIAFWIESGTGTNVSNDDDPSDNLSHYFQGNYMRDTSGHNETSDGGSTKLLVVENVPFDIICSRDQVAGVGGIITLHTTNNFFRIKKVN